MLNICRMCEMGMSCKFRETKTTIEIIRNGRGAAEVRRGSNSYQLRRGSNLVILVRRPCLWLPVLLVAQPRFVPPALPWRQPRLVVVGVPPPQPLPVFASSPSIRTVIRVGIKESILVMDLFLKKNQNDKSDNFTENRLHKESKQTCTN